MRSAGSLRWRPNPFVTSLRGSEVLSIGPTTLARFASSVKLRTDFGPPQPAGRPKEGTGLYVVEPKGRERSFFRFLGVAKAQFPYILASAVFVAAYSATTLAIPHGFGQLIDYATRGEMPWSLSWQLVGWFFLAGAANWIRLSLSGHAGEKIVAELRESVYRATINQPTTFFDEPENRTGALVQRVTMDTSAIGSVLTEGLSNGVKNVCQMAGSLGIMLYFSPKLTAAIVLVLPPVAIFAGTYGRYVRRLQQQKNDAQSSLTVLSEERLSNIRTVKAFGREAQELLAFMQRAGRVTAIGRKMAFYNATYVAFLHVSGYLTLYVIIWAGSLLVASNDLTAGTLFSFMLYTVYCGLGIMGVTNSVSELNKGYGGSLRLFDIIDRERALRDAARLNPGIIPPSATATFGKQATSGVIASSDISVSTAPTHEGVAGAPLASDGASASTATETPSPPSFLIGKFHFQNVGFAYPTRPNSTVFRDLTLTIEPGQCTCVVGTSGTGKSSLAWLLLRMYSVTNGAVVYDGINIEKLDLGWLRGAIGLVPQEPVLFGGTIAQNIAYGLPGRDWDAPIDGWVMTAVKEAARAANAHDFVQSLPEQYATFVGESGRSLSGGQKQRIAIARALIKKPQLLILDEATSALDSESEAVVQDAIEALIRETRQFAGSKKAVLLFAHRLSMIRQADTIIVLHEGRVIDSGSFDHVCLNPIFRQLVGINETPVDSAAAPPPPPPA